MLSMLSPLNLTVVALGTALLHLWAEHIGARWLTYVAKPLTMVLIIGLALRAATPVDASYQWWLVVGLLFALVGDIFLMLPSDRFLAGLVSFLVTHLCYTVAFWGQIDAPYWSSLGLSSLGLSLLGLMIYAGIVYGLLHHHVGAMRFPVLIYLAAILIMAWLALTMAHQQPGAWADYAAWGSIFFVLSDSVLALNRFRRPFGAAQWIVLSSYYFAQWLIALSLYT